MQLETLRLFVDLIETGSFSQAAERSDISQSAASQRIAAVEKDLQVKLVSRGKHLQTTPEGELFLRLAREVISSYDHFRRELYKCQDEVSGVLTLATVYSLGLHQLPPYLKRFRERYPHVSIDVRYYRSGEVYQAIRNHQAELGLVAYPQASGDLEAKVCWEDELVLICPLEHPLAAVKRVSLAQLEGERFITFAPDLPTQQAVDSLLARHRVEVRSILALDNVELIKRAVEVEQALAILPKRTVFAEVEGGRLALAHLDTGGEPVIRPMGMIYLKEPNRSDAFREFTKLICTRQIVG